VDYAFLLGAHKKNKASHGDVNTPSKLAKASYVQVHMLTENNSTI
jgi:hypothetical protein